MKKNKKIVVLTAESRLALFNLIDKIPNRFIDVGISEQNLVGISAGLAKKDMFPIIHAMSAFLTMRSFEFIRTDLGYPSLPSILVGAFNGLSEVKNGTGNGPTHQAIEDIALMKLVPNMTIFAPADIDEASQCFKNLKNIHGPVYLRYTNVQPFIHNKNKKFVWGENILISPGTQIAILSFGEQLKTCLDVRDKLKENGIKPAIYNVRFVHPINENFIRNILKKFKTIVIVEDHIPIGGLTSTVKEIAFNVKSNTQIISINLKNWFFKPGNYQNAIDDAGFSAIKIYEKIIKELN